MQRGTNFDPPERYAIEDGQYVLYVGAARVLVTPAVAVLIDRRLGVLITHGDPASVRWELDEMRRVLPNPGGARYDEDWLLIEGRPQLDDLNASLAGSADIFTLRQAFDGEDLRYALRRTRELLARMSRRS